jgi:hypothetical protein
MKRFLDFYSIGGNKGAGEIRERHEIVKILESLPFRPMYSTDAKIGLLLVWSGLKPATDITLGKEWERGEAEKTLTDEEVEEAKRKLASAGLWAVELPKESGALDEPGEHSADYLPPYFYEEQEFFVAKDEGTARALRDAQINRRHDVFGKLCGFPETAIRAFLQKKKNREKFMEVDDLPLEIRSEDYMAFLFFKLSKDHWLEELEVAKEWSKKIKELDYELYKEALISYRKELLASLKKELESIKDNLGKPIDEGIKETVLYLRAFGLPTDQSCEGHLNRGLPAPWVEIYPEEPAVKNWQENEEFRNKVLEEKKKLKNKAIKLLEEFYKDRKVENGIKLGLRDIGYGFRIQSNWLTQFEKNKGKVNKNWLTALKKEMADFTNFLKEKYLKGEEL